MYENKKDRENQTEVMDLIVQWYESLPAIGRRNRGFYHEVIPTVEGESEPDFQLWWNGACIAVVEIKCRTKDYIDDGWMISKGKLNSIYKNYVQHGVAGLLAFAAVGDDGARRVWMTDIRDVLAARDILKEAKEAFTITTNHGTKQRTKTDVCLILPRHLFWRVAE